MDVQSSKNKFAVKTAVFSKLIYRFNTSPNRIGFFASFFVEIDKLTLKCIWKFKGARTAKIILKKNKIRGLILPNFKTYYTKLQ